MFRLLCAFLLSAFISQCQGINATCNNSFSIAIYGLASSPSRCIQVAKSLQTTAATPSVKVSCVSCTYIYISGSTFCRPIIKASFQSSSSLNRFTNGTSLASLSLLLMNNKTTPCGLNTSLTIYGLVDSCGKTKSTFMLKSKKCPSPPRPPPSPRPRPPLPSNLTLPVCNLTLRTPTSSISACSSFLSALTAGSTNLTLGLSRPPLTSGCGPCTSDDYGECIIDLRLSFYSTADLLVFYANTGALPWDESGPVSLPLGSIDHGYDALVMDVLPAALGYIWNGCTIYKSSCGLGAMQSVYGNSRCGVNDISDE